MEWNYKKMILPSKIKLVVFGNLNYPYGSAATNRIQAYSKGIVEKKYNVLVINIRGSFRKKVNFNCKGTYEGVNYIYSSYNLYRKSNFFSRNFFKLYGFFNGIYLILKIKKHTQNFAILEFSTTFFNELILYIITRIIRIPIIREENEIPDVLRNNIKNPIKIFLDLKVRTKLYDGIIVISNYLQKQFSSLIKKNTLSILIPILVDLNRFFIINHNSEIPQYIAYCGSPSGNKDGVPILIKAFSIISKKYKTIKLYILGDTPGSNVLHNLNNLAKKLNVGHRIVFTGTVPRDKMPEYLCNASILALSRPTSFQAKGGFPTKLGEYLATGKPVVVTKVGEIPNYLKDGENAFLSEPDSAEAFAKKLDYVLSHPELAKKVGQKGKEVAQKYFNYKTQAKRIIEFIDKLNKNL